MTSTRPYLIRAIYEWCCDNEFTPHIIVEVDEHCLVPFDRVADGQITFNISHHASQGLSIGNDFLKFTAYFGGNPFDMIVPIGRVIAVYARENAEGINLGSPVETVVVQEEASSNASRARLKLVK